MDELLDAGFLPGRASSGSGGSGTRIWRPPARVREPRAAVATVQEAAPDQVSPASDRAARPDFSLFFFGNYGAEYREDKYDLIFRGTRFADRHGFSAVYLPERHFHSFGGFSPNPSVLAAALARETDRIHLRAGSVVMPLHHPARVAEEWAVVDNLSRGRVGLSIASGWHPDDFVFSPDAYERRRERMVEGIDVVRRLWRGETLELPAGAGSTRPVKLHPMPRQPELPLWLTASHRETFVRAGELGTGILTNLQAQPIDRLPECIAAYRESLERHGHDPRAGRVVLLLHTLVGEDLDTVRELAREPFYGYLRSSLKLVKNFADSKNMSVDFDRLSDEEMQHLLAGAYERYSSSSALIGTPSSCTPIVERLRDMGVDEVGCLIDFGVPVNVAEEGLEHLSSLRRLFTEPGPPDRGPGVPESEPHRIPGRSGAPAETLVAESPGAGAAAGTEPTEPRALPLSEGQRGLWALAQLGPDASRAYHESVTLDLSGAASVPALAEALDSLADRHEALRTTFSADGSHQLVWPSARRPLPVVDVSGLPERDRRQAAEEWLRRESHRLFDLEAGPLLRTGIARLSPRRHFLVLSMHHLVTDGHSTAVLLRELSALYRATLRGEPVDLPPPVPFRRYLDVREEQAAAKEEAERYWLGVFADRVPVVDLPTDRPRPHVQTFAGTRQRSVLPQSLRTRLQELARRRRTSLFVTLLAAYQLLLSRLSGALDVVVGIDSADPFSVGKEGLIGFFVNPLPLRNRIDPQADFASHLLSVKRRLWEAHENQEFAFHELIRRLGASHQDPSRPPIFSVSFTLEGAGAPALDGLDVEMRLNLTETSKFDLSFNMIDHGEGLELLAEYNTDLFDGTTVRRWAASFATLLDAITKSPEVPVRELPVLPRPERQHLLYEWNDTAAALPLDAGFSRFFTARVRERPDAVAAVGKLQLTYGELDERARRLARHVVRWGGTSDGLVALLAERGVDFLSAMLGAFQAGGAYLPMDPNHPPARHAGILEDSGAKILLVGAAFHHAAQEALALMPRDKRPKVLPLEEHLEAPAPDVDLPAADPSNRLAYVIYTSGSTGTPKGAMVEHSGMLNHLFAKVRDLGLTGEDCVAQTASQCFDISVWQYLAPLLVGGRVCVLTDEEAHDPWLLSRNVETLGVDILETVPSLLRLLLEELERKGDRRPSLQRLRFLLTTGEVLPPDVGRRWLELSHHIPLLNAYGPTECSDDVTHQPLTSISEEVLTVPIGRSLVNTRLHVLDSRTDLVPLGAEGELCVGGAGVGRGYRGEPRRTALAFVPDPFSPAAGGRLYRTGDRVRHLASGELLFLGRFDHQVKVRGFRIELGEIEAFLARRPEIDQAVVVTREAARGDLRLVAYLVGRGGKAAAEQIATGLRAGLPEYMIPSEFL
ncbi:MAG: MupA/Atu3671 family FMN-dependent luciferase-like monooxygenase, partial [bacterium]